MVRGESGGGEIDSSLTSRPNNRKGQDHPRGKRAVKIVDARGSKKEKVREGRQMELPIHKVV